MSGESRKGEKEGKGGRSCLAGDRPRGVVDLASHDAPHNSEKVW